MAPSSSDSGAHKFAEAITKFCLTQRAAIEKEISEAGIPLHDKWGLDLTATCLTGLLGLWADRTVPLSLVLDDSKLLVDWWTAAQDFYPIRTGPNAATDPSGYVIVEGRTNRVRFALASIPQFKLTPGLQIADVVAAVVSDAFQEPITDGNRALIKTAMVVGAIDQNCIFADSDYIDPSQPGTLANQALLWEIIRRATSGESVPKCGYVSLRRAAGA